MTPPGARTRSAGGILGRTARGLALLLAAAWTPAPAAAQPAAALPYQVQAVFLFNFTQFVTWPAAAFQPGAPFVICVLGEDPFGSFLDATVAGEIVQGRSLQVRRLQRAEDAESCHIAYVSRSESARVADILARLRTHAILTVSDIEDFARSGGVIRLFVENRRVRVRVNVDAARAAGLTISSKLLRIADIVGAEAH